MHTPHGLETVLAALPTGRLRRFHLEFLDVRRLDGTGAQFGLVNLGRVSGVNLARFTHLDTLIVHCGPMIEDVHRLRETVASWWSTMAASQKLILYTAMCGVWEGLWGGGDLEILHKYADVVEETCNGMLCSECHHRNDMEPLDAVFANIGNFK